MIIYLPYIPHQNSSASERELGDTSTTAAPSSPAGAPNLLLPEDPNVLICLWVALWGFCHIPTVPFISCTSRLQSIPWIGTIVKGAMPSGSSLLSAAGWQHKPSVSQGAHTALLAEEKGFCHHRRAANVDTLIALLAEPEICQENYVVIQKDRRITCTQNSLR